MAKTDNTRQVMIAGAADLISRRGVNGTSIRDVIQWTDTPRGSVTHHFPGGKPQLLEEVIADAGGRIARNLQAALHDKGLVNGLKAFVNGWIKLLEATGYEAGCPVLAVAIEPYAGDKNQDKQAHSEVQTSLLSKSSEAFADWQGILVAAMQADGIEPARARRLARLVIASVEGAIALCRVEQSAQPLKDVRVELEALLSQAAVSP